MRAAESETGGVRDCETERGDRRGAWVCGAWWLMPSTVLCRCTVR